MRELAWPRLGERGWRDTLPNGLEIVVVHKPYHTKRYALFAVGYGGMDLCFDLDGQRRQVPAGTAHYLEHELFETEDGSAMQKLGMAGVDPNAFTSEEMTAYYFECTDRFYEHLEELLRFVSVPYFTRESVEKERGVIAQELRMTEDDPEWRVYEGMLECLYGDRPVALPVLGTAESIARITPEILYDCHRAFYVPANMVLVCVGDVDPERAAQIAAAVLPAERGAKSRRETDGDRTLAPFRRETQRVMEVSMPMFLAGFKCPAGLTGEALLRQSIIGGLACDALFGESSPLYARLYREGLVNSSLGGSFDQLPGACFLSVGGDTWEPRKVVEEILAEALRLGEDGIPAGFFEQLRRAAYGGMLRGLDAFEDIAVSMAEGYLQGYDYYRFPEVFDTVTKADVEAFLREDVTPGRAAVSLILPRSGGHTDKEE